jgi:hypothetical protein
LREFETGPEAPVMTTTMQRPDVSMIAALIGRSRIVVTRSASPQGLPAGFEDVDVAILDWIAAEGRRLGRILVAV